MKFGSFHPENLRGPHNDNWQKLSPGKNKEFIEALQEMMTYFEGLHNLSNDVVSQRILRQAQEDLQKEPTEHLVDLVIKSSKADWQSKPSFYAALMFVLHTRTEPDV